MSVLFGAYGTFKNAFFAKQARSALKTKEENMNFVCPKCKGMLTVLDGGVAKCPKNHTYDRARAGYYNLLLSAGGNHGDNIEMVNARRNFLCTGAYLPLAEKVAELAAAYISGGRVLDIGCGEGYYTDILERRLRIERDSVKISGFDISRDAVKYAAKRNGALELAVASAYHMPVADNSFDMAINMFSPLVPSEIYRALTDGGIFIMAIPGEEHLFGLKRVAYDSPYKNSVSDPDIEGFSLLDTERVKYRLTLDSRESIASLFMMTPYAYRTRPSDKVRVLALERLETDVDFIVFVYKRAAGPKTKTNTR